MYTMDRWNSGSELIDPQTGKPVTDVKGYLSIYLSEVFRDDRKNIDECIKLSSVPISKYGVTEIIPTYSREESPD